MRCVIGEDEALLRQGVHLVLQSAGFEVAAAVGDAEELIKASHRLRPDVVITDIRMPPGHSDDGLRAAITIRRELPGTGVMVLSQFVQRRYALELIGDDPAGVGYQLKQRIADVERFCADVAAVAAGGTVLDPEVVTLMVDRLQRDHGVDDRSPLERLTDRQQDVLALIAQGRSNAAIAVRLTISEKAVVQHTSRIYDVLGLPNEAHDHRRVLAVVRYLNR